MLCGFDGFAAATVSVLSQPLAAETFQVYRDQGSFRLKKVFGVLGGPFIRFLIICIFRFAAMVGQHVGHVILVQQFTSADMSCFFFN